MIFSDTYGVESISVTNSTDGSTVITCNFYSFSTDSGCTIQLVQYDTVQYTGTFTRDGSIAEGSIPSVVTGIYDILAYDEGSYVVATSVEGVILVGIIPTSTITMIRVISGYSSFFPIPSNISY